MDNICFNERQNIWTTRYDWIPLISENINDKFFSIGGIQSSIDTNEKIWEHDYDASDVTKWFNTQHGFEFEFVVSDPVGVQKIFDNLQIISNNVQPNELEITIIGDDYEFKRDLVTLDRQRAIRKEVSDQNPNNIRTTSNVHGQEPKEYKETKLSTRYEYDKRLNQSTVVKWQPVKDIYKYGRRVGNTQYKEDSWYTQIEPIYLNKVGQREREARIRDKWARIRIRYTGEDLAVITAIRTLINI